MTNPTPKNTEIAILDLPIIATSLDVHELMRRNKQLLRRPDVERFPHVTGGGRLYNKMLWGVPFVFVSEGVFRTETTGMYGPQSVFNAHIRVLNIQTGEFQDAEMCQLSGGWVLAQLRNMTRGDIVGSRIFTITKNMQRLSPGGQPTWHLATWNIDEDRAQEYEEDVVDMTVTPRLSSPTKRSASKPISFYEEPDDEDEDDEDEDEELEAPSVTGRRPVGRPRGSKNSR